MKKLLFVVVLVFVPFLFTFSQTGHWEQLYPTTLPSERCLFGMANLIQDKVLLFGGLTNYGYSDETWLYDSKKNIWTKLTIQNSPYPRAGLGMIQLSNGKILMFGGKGNDSINYNIYFNDTWLFDSETMQWSKVFTNSTPFKIMDFAFSRINDNQALIFGGDASDIYMGNDIVGNVNYTWKFDLYEKKWYMLSVNNYSPSARWGVRMCQLDSNNILLFGGIKKIADTWIFDCKNLKWDSLKLKENATPKKDESLIQLDSNMAIWYADNETWIYYNEFKAWKKLFVSTSPSAGIQHQLVKLDSNKVLLFGGVTSKGYFNETWILTIDDLTDIKEEVIIPNDSILNVVFVDNNLIHIEYKINKPGNLEFELIDICGRIVKKFENANNQNWNNEVDIEVKDLVNGVYLIVLKYNYGICYKRIIKG